ncbi:hypothetical protein BHM03_00005137 [Ensete ventricosum]|nr:hypothetical protein BHM03_00005137 [Ensete ventricosum]
MEAGTLEEYAAVLSFELSRRKRYTAKIVLGAEAQDPDNGAPILAKDMIRATGELDGSRAYIHLREHDKSEDKTEGKTSVESSIPYSHQRRALVVKGAEEVENEETNSKNRDKTEM